MTHTSLSHWGMHEIDPAAEYCRTELTQPLPECTSDLTLTIEEPPVECDMTTAYLLGYHKRDYKVAQFKAELVSIKANTLPELPEGWTLKCIEINNHGFGFRAVLDRINITQWAYGSTPREAVLAAIEKIGGV